MSAGRNSARQGPCEKHIGAYAIAKRKVDRPARKGLVPDSSAAHHPSRCGPPDGHRRSSRELKMLAK